MRALLLDDEESGHLALHASRDQDRPWLSSSLDARGDIRRFAEHFASCVHNHLPGLEADARHELLRGPAGVPGVEFAERPLDGERGAHRAYGGRQWPSSLALHDDEVSRREARLGLLDYAGDNAPTVWWAALVVSMPKNR